MEVKVSENEMKEKHSSEKSVYVGGGVIIQNITYLI